MRTISTLQPFEFLVRVNPRGYQFEFGLEGVAFLGYAFKAFYECGVTISKGPYMEQHHFEYL